MSYAIRNTLIIALFWAVVLAGGFYYIYGYQGSKQEKLLTERQGLRHKLEDLKILQANLIEMHRYYARLQEISQGKKGVIASEETPGETYDYILRELKSRHSNLLLNLSFVKTDTISGIEQRTYDLGGNSTFYDLYRMLWFLENGPVFYGLKKLDIERIDENEHRGYIAPDAEIEFSITMQAFEEEKGPQLAEMVLQNGEPQKLANLVKNGPGIRKPDNYSYAKPQLAASRPNVPAKNNYDSSLPAISSTSKVLAITPNSVIIETSPGKTIKLRVGDKVNGGYLRNISTKNSNAIFEMSGESGQLVLSVTQK